MSTQEEMKEEAVRRMKGLNILGNVVLEFDNENTLYYSENLGGFAKAVLYWADNLPELTAEIKNFEEKHDAVVYHVILSHLEYGDCYSFLYVNDDGDWESDRCELLRDGYAFVYVWNETCKMFSEFGSIMLKPAMGGLLRTA